MQTSEQGSAPVPAPEMSVASTEAPAAPGATPPDAVRKGPPPALLESLVALALMLSLSGVVMPAVADGVAESRVIECQATMHDIARGIAAYSADTLFLPTGREGRTTVAWLYGPGALPVGNTFIEGGEGRALDDVLMSDVMGGHGWKGPYVAGLEPDPWGRAYLVNVDGWIDPRETPMVLSAGPNGVVETSEHDTQPGGDDILLLLD